MFQQEVRGASQGWLVATAHIQNSVHHFGACGDDGAEFVAVDEFCGGGAVVAGQAGDLSMGTPSADIRETKV